MKKMTYFVMALAMVLGLTQCKKEQIATTENEGEKVTITLRLNNGSRGHIVPGENTASVVYDNGDIIMVGFNGAYVGDLMTTDGSNFSGNVDISGEPSDGKIYFYYLDGKSQDVNSGKCFVDISDQTSGLPVISYACVDYSSSNTYSNVKMHNQCGLVKFNTTDVAGAITILGVNNQMEVDFTAHSFTPKNPGNVTLNGTSGTTRWAILLEQQDTVNATVTATGYENGTCKVPPVSNNAYIAGDDAVSISLTPTLTETTITWNSSTVNTINVSGNGSSFSNNGITVTSNSSNAKWNNSGGISTITLKSTSDKLTFSTADGTITKIVITLNPTSGSVEGTPSSGWSYNGLPNYTLTWTGSSSSVDLGCVSSKGIPGGGIGIETEKFKVAAITNVEFTVQQ